MLIYLPAVIHRFPLLSYWSFSNLPLLEYFWWREYTIHYFKIAMFPYSKLIFKPCRPGKPCKLGKPCKPWTVLSIKFRTRSRQQKCELRIQIFGTFSGSRCELLLGFSICTIDYTKCPRLEFIALCGNFGDSNLSSFPHGQNPVLTRKKLAKFVLGNNWTVSTQQ